MYEFIQQVRDLLVAMGVNNVTTYGHSITVGGHEFDCTRRGRAKSVRVNSYYIDARFCRTPQTAVQYIIESLPQIVEKKKEEAEESKKRRERSAKYSKLNDECLAINDHIDGTNCKVTADVDTNVYSLTFSHKDKSTILAAIDYLQEGGFCETDSAKMGDGDFIMGQARFFFKNLSIQQKKVLFRMMTSHLEDLEAQEEEENQAKEDPVEIGGES